jgi:hypothetical protein
MAPARPAPRARRLAAAHNGLAVSRAEIAWAVPAGTRRARDQREFLRAVVAWPGLAEQRSDRRANLLEVARILARYASWADRTTRPTRAKVCGLARIGITTWKRCRRQLQAWGFMGIVRQGRSADFLPAILAEDRNEAAVYVLTVPDRPAPAPPAGSRENGPPSEPRSGVDRSHTRASDPNTGNRTALRADSPAKPAGLPAIEKAGVLKNLSDRAIRHFWRPFELAGWTPRDWLFAVDHLPGGQQHRRDMRDVIYPAGWLKWRLGHWLDDAGAPVASRSQRWARIHQADVDRRGRQHAQRAALAAAAAPPTPEYLQAREQRGWTRKG